MKNMRFKSMLPGDQAEETASLDELTHARATLLRLAEIHARCSADMKKVLRQAKKLRRQLLVEARNSNHEGNS
jgi:hypothetical protein